MNISLNKAVYCDSQGNEYYFDNMFVQARNIRYVHIPETVSNDNENLFIKLLSFIHYYLLSFLFI